MAYLQDIVAARRARVAQTGPELGESIPTRRQVPLVPFVSQPLLVCEIKRSSPSRGAIAPDLDAVAQARRYAAAGVRSVSILTEQDHFDGALADLMAVKVACPELAVLRKDFLLDERDLEVSYRAGADAVLLLAACLSADELRAMHRKATELGMAALVEVHDQHDLAKARALRPPLTGINSRDLTTFAVDLSLPARLRPAVDWPTTLLFESGIGAAEDAAFARSSGFDGVLVGEAVVRRPELVGELRAALEHHRSGFWQRLFGALHGRQAQQQPGRPLIKICGITNRADAELATELGADLLGLIMAPSPRQAPPELAAELRDLSVLKVAVVVDDPGPARELARDGLIDVLQLHGDEPPERCYELGFPYYKALRIREVADYAAAASYRAPRVLFDAYAPHARGGTGRQIAQPLLDARPQSAPPLWLAGGLGADNVATVLQRYRPELLDASTRLERDDMPGRKDTAKLRAYVAAVQRGVEQAAARKSA